MVQALEAVPHPPEGWDAVQEQRQQVRAEAEQHRRDFARWLVEHGKVSDTPPSEG